MPIGRWQPTTSTSTKVSEPIDTADTLGRWNNPKSIAGPSKVTTLSASVGGGSFNVVPGAGSNVLVRTPRSQDAIGAPKAGEERDHIIPVSLGGVSDKNNLEYLKSDQSFLDKILHRPPSQQNRQEGKLTVEESAIKDYKAGKISLDEAREQVLTKKRQLTGLEPTDAQQTTAGQFGSALVDTITHPIQTIKNIYNKLQTATPEQNAKADVINKVGKFLAPGGVQSALGGVAAKTAVAVAQAVPRLLISAGLNSASELVNKPPVYTPQGRWQQTLLGKEPITGLGTKTVETGAKVKNWLVKKGVNPDLAGGMSLGISSVFTAGTAALDLVPLAGAEGKMAEAAGNLAKIGTAEEVLPVLKNLFKGSEDSLGTLSETVAKMNKPGEIEGLLKSFARKQEVLKTATAGETIARPPAAAPYKEIGDLTTKILQKLEGRSTVSKQFISDLTNSGDLKQAEKDIVRNALETETGKDVDVAKFAEKVKKELLPLEAKGSDVYKAGTSGETGGEGMISEGKFTPRYEGITLPQDLRGEVDSYKENIYNSPVKTSAGNIHFDYNTDNYFGHTRVEDMADNTTRRVIEVQSDLYQKGRLENEMKPFEPETVDYTSGERKVTPGQRLDLTKEKAKLQQYNDPTAHFRMVREEVKQAAVDGKTKLQFPTGETAMKIEGLGERNNWKIITSNGSEIPLNTGSLEIGREIDNDGGKWIITDVAGDGKFKAIPKDASLFDKSVAGTTEVAPGIFGNQSAVEAFDISGKVDTNNPIYKFYEKDLGKYLQNKYGAKVVEDAQGVKWYEVPVKDEYKGPVQAFKKSGPREFAYELTREEAAQKIKESLGIKKDVEVYLNKRMPHGALGTYQDAWIQLLEKSGKASEFVAHHEAWHLVKDLYLDPKEASALEETFAKEFPEKLDALRAKYPELDEHGLAEEAIADEWAKYNQTGKSFSEKAKAIFAKIRQRVETLFGKKKELLEYFKNIKQKVGEEHAAATEGRYFKNESIKKATPEELPFENVSRPPRIVPEAESAIGSTFPEKSFEASTESSQLARTPQESPAVRNLAKAVEEKPITTPPKVKNVSYSDSITKPDLSQGEAKGAAVVSDLNASTDLPDAASVASPDVLSSAEKFKDISGFKAQARDVYRNFKQVFGNKFPEIKKALLDPFDAAKGKYVDFQQNLLDEMHQKIVKDLGIEKGSKESAAVMDFGEGLQKESDLISNFGTEKAKKIKEAAEWFRNKYDSLLEEVNAVRKEIYPNSPEKIIPKRKDYFRHFEELSTGLEALKNIFENPAGISPKLAGISAFTTPRSKWLSFAQRRLAKDSTRDAVGGFLNYIPSAAYAINIDPFIGKFRALGRDLATATEQSKNINNFIEFLHDYANDLSGKSNAADRFIQKVIPGGRKTFAAINWLNSRVKANTILGNLSSAVSQIFNVPQGIASAKQYAIPGATKTLAQIFQPNDAMQLSDFIKERYSSSMYDKFDKGILANTKKFASWVVGALDEVGTKFIWNSHYEKAVAEKIPNPVKYADDVTRNLVAGRGIGEVPLIQKSKLFQMVAPFQLEVGNLWYVMGDMVKGKDFAGLATLFVANYLMNQVAKKVRGSDVTFDPINALVEGFQNQEKDESLLGKVVKVGGRLAGEVLSNVPLGQSMAGLYPEKGLNIPGVGQMSRSELFGEGDPTRFGTGTIVAGGLNDPLFKILPGFAGGQLKKTYQGAKAVIEGGQKSKAGAPLFDIKKTPGNIIRAAAFGPYATTEGQNYSDAQNALTAQQTAKSRVTSIAENKFQPKFDSIQQLIAAGKNDEAQKAVDALTDPEYIIYKKMKTALKTKTTAKTKSSMYDTYQQVQGLLSQGKNDEAQAMVDGMTDAEYKAYQTLKKQFGK